MILVDRVYFTEDKNKLLLGTVRRKYSTGLGSKFMERIQESNVVSGHVIGKVPQLQHEMCKLLHASLASSTWARYGSGWKAFELFENYMSQKFTLPLSMEVVRAFATFCIVVKKLKTSSVKTYLSSLVHVHKMHGYTKFEIKDQIVASILRGADHIQMMEPVQTGSRRRVMTIQLLRHLGHRLAVSGWSAHTKQVIWTACTLAFFTSARMGELLSPGEHDYDPASTLTWSCIRYRADNSFLVHVRLPKSAAKEGEFLDVFEFPRFGCCPVAALKRLMVISGGSRSAGQPVFTFASGKFLTVQGLNSILKELLSDVVDPARDSISCHSFRAAVPSALTRHPTLATSDDVKGWGRWSSEAYQRYTRLKTDQKRSIFNKIMAVLT
jgi:hypothetical protein